MKSYDSSKVKVHCNQLIVCFFFCRKKFVMISPSTVNVVVSFEWLDLRMLKNWAWEKKSKVWFYVNSKNVEICPPSPQKCCSKSALDTDWSIYDSSNLGLSNLHHTNFPSERIWSRREPSLTYFKHLRYTIKYAKYENHHQVLF